MAKKGTAKGTAARHDLAKRLAECAAQTFIVDEGIHLQPDQLETEIRARLGETGLVALFEEILSREVTSVVIPKGAEPPPCLGPGTIVELSPTHAASDTAGEIVEALGMAAAKGWESPMCILNADPELAIVKLLQGNGKSTLKEHRLYTPMPVKDVAAYIRRVVEAIG